MSHVCCCHGVTGPALAVTTVAECVAFCASSSLLGSGAQSEGSHEAVQITHAQVDGMHALDCLLDNCVGTIQQR